MAFKPLSDYMTIKKLLMTINSEGYSLKNSNRLKCMFAHIPRTAGTAISQALFSHHVGHYRLSQYKDIYPPQKLQDYFKFAFVRNPWDKVASSYYYLQQGGFGHHDKLWFHQHLAAFKDFRAFVRGWLPTSAIHLGHHFVPQSNYILDSQLKMDFIGYFENIAADFAYVKTQLKADCALKHINQRTQKDDYRNHYDDECRQVVATVYADDIKLLGYDFDATLKPWEQRRGT